MKNGPFSISIWLNRICIIIYLIILLGGFYQEIEHDMLPCELCFLQRISMLSISISCFWNLFRRISVTHYGFGIASALLGAFISTRQILLHICPQFSTFGYPVYGLELYTWALISFIAYIIGSCIGLFLYNENFSKYQPSLQWFDKILVGFFTVITIANLISSFFMDKS